MVGTPSARAVARADGFAHPTTPRNSTRSSALARPPYRWRVLCGNLGWPQCHEMAALVGIAAQLRAVLAAHVALQLVNRRRLRTPDDIQRHGLVGIAAETPHFQIEVSGAQRVADGRRGLGRTLVAEHARVPGLAGEQVGFLAGFLGTLRRHPDRSAVEIFSRLR